MEFVIYNLVGYETVWGIYSCQDNSIFYMTRMKKIPTKKMLKELKTNSVKDEIFKLEEGDNGGTAEEKIRRFERENEVVMLFRI